MTRVYLGVGSNTDREYHIGVALDWLRVNFSSLRCSAVYESAAIGFDGRPFFNLVVEIETSLALGEIAQDIKTLEFAYGREPDALKFAPRNIDIDILLFGDAVGIFEGVLLPRGEIVQNAFVLRPLAELAGDRLHPELGVSYARLWSDFDQSSQPLEVVPFPGTPTIAVQI